MIWRLTDTLAEEKIYLMDPYRMFATAKMNVQEREERNGVPFSTHILSFKVW